MHCWNIPSDLHLKVFPDFAQNRSWQLKTWNFAVHFSSTLLWYIFLTPLHFMPLMFLSENAAYHQLPQTCCCFDYWLFPFRQKSCISFLHCICSFQRIAQVMCLNLSRMLSEYDGWSLTRSALCRQNFWAYWICIFAELVVVIPLLVAWEALQGSDRLVE